MLRKRTPENKDPVERIIITLSIILSVVLVALVIGIGLELKKETPKKTSDYTATTDDNSLRRGETGQTLSPPSFSDSFIAESYQIAKDIPHVMDSLECYCFCDRHPINHKSLLSCYVETHAAG